MTSVTAPKTLTEMLRQYAAVQPQAVASIDVDGQLSFAELWEGAGRAAAALAATGVDPHDSIGLFMAPSNRLLIATWAILRADASYLPLAVDYPEERISYMIADSKIRHVVVDAESHDLVEHLVPEHVQVIRIEQLVQEAPGLASSTCTEDRPAYVIYTSGSTGRPKGVVIQHPAIVNQMRFLAESAGLLPGERILLKTPISFDAAQWELLANAAGATVIVGPHGVHRDADLICDLVLEHRVNLLQAVPTLWTALLEVRKLSQCSSLKGLFSGGEVLPSHLASELLAVIPQAQLVNFYGPTETTINATWLRLTAEEIPDAPAVSIGSAVPGCRVHILDANLLPVPDGQIGELCISGSQLAAGYLHRPELTAERFVEVAIDSQQVRVYRSGDLAGIGESGDLEFHGRSDDQVKVNGHRVETDEVRLAIEDHHWVRQAAVVPWRSADDGTTRLGAFLELDPTEAALMDQGAAGEHHRSKASHVQVKAQLAGLGVRSVSGDPRDIVVLPGREGSPGQFRAAFARKTYRFYEGGPISAEDLAALGESLNQPWTVQPRCGAVTVTEIADILRWMGPFQSSERLLPKYAYASPGALNATQIYLETTGIPGLDAGLYYYHPIEHELIRIGQQSAGLSGPGIRLHLVGLPRVIESVYSTNVVEVLYMEAGHMAGVLDRAVAAHGLYLHARNRVDVPELGLAEEWVGSAVFDLMEGPAADVGKHPVDLTLQVHGKVTGARQGTHRIKDRTLHRLSDHVIERRQVIAINQGTYDRSSFGVTLSCPRGQGWNGFLQLGRALQKLEMNDLGIGLMSSGYASLSGSDLPSAVRYDEIARTWGQDQSRLSYFAVGGTVSAEQVRSTGMKEDSVHLRGPEEIVKDDLRRTLPHYMVPSRVEVIDRLPMSSSGKVDRTRLIQHLENDQGHRRAIVPAASPLEATCLKVWSRVLGQEVLSVSDDFFDIGGNSLTAVKLINALNEHFGSSLPVQSIFEAPTARELAGRIGQRSPVGASRLVLLAAGSGAPIFLWPGLGGYPMSLRALAAGISQGRPVYGIQAHGLNLGEHPYITLEETVAADGETILAAVQDEGVTLMGYSFGARMATEVALWLERHGLATDRLILIAPGSPEIEGVPDIPREESPTFADSYFRMVLMSVFTGSLEGLASDLLLAKVRNRQQFIELLAARVPTLDEALASRIIDVVTATYKFRSIPASNIERLLPQTQLLIATGDGPSFASPYRCPLEDRGAVVELEANHYQILREPAVALTVSFIMNLQEQPA
ncbi:non-ribosomal peptide synthetase family protein [Pseudarthrobacter polychromogenes]|uniref:Carrier domain-containing protein n=1 Tax=Pseudarthrobacter polychromogenes TaxID=1676 RepID=A0ABQ1Y1W8_9MICC|nr:amino acid adenylation domain-containing protein [Pseudarthrobacter polychromogenes]MBD1593879.1 amino acid adenylation domain-containing protein [Arthrobacter sp. S1_S22]GGH10016.1 hypothetical protein GCM10011577_38700 [Pseudarthrobacter polychromogenes]